MPLITFETLRRVMRGMPRLLIAVGLLLIAGCAGMPAKEKHTGPVVQPLDPASSHQHALEKRDPADRASLWRQSAYREMFRDLRAARIGDLVTVNIVETSKANKKANTKTSRDSSIDAGITNLMGWETKLDKLGVPGAFSNTQMFRANMKNGFAGSGETSRDETMTASITARVVDVMPDGNLFIRGSREVKVNSESQFIILSGLIRPSDISPDNTILSSYIADAKIAYTGKGPVSDKQKPGWLLRLVDHIWPF